MGKYKGPLPTSSSTSTSKAKSSIPSSTSVTQRQKSAIEAAASIADKIRQEDFKEQTSRDQVLQSRKFLKHLRQDPSSFLSSISSNNTNKFNNSSSSSSTTAATSKLEQEKREKAKRYLEEFQRHYLESQKKQEGKKLYELEAESYSEQLANAKKMKKEYYGENDEDIDDDDDIFEHSSLRSNKTPVDKDGNVLMTEKEAADEFIGIENNDGAFLPNNNNNTQTGESGDLINDVILSRRRAKFEIPTLAQSVPAEAWIARPKLLDSKRHPTSMTRRGRNRITTSPSSEEHQQQGEEVVSNSNTNDEYLNFKEIDRFLLSPALAHIFSQRRREWSLKKPSAVQSLVLECCLSEKRDVCCLAPTGTGKTLCYALPAIQAALEANGLADESSTYSITEARLQERDFQRGAEDQQKIDEAAHECKYCGLDIRQQKVCPQTGAPHPPALPSSSSQQQQQGNFLNRNNVSSIGTPASLIICPSGILVDQAYTILRSLRCGLKIGFLRGSSDNAVREQMSESLTSCDVLVSTTGYALWALNKGILNLSTLKFFAIDEIDKVIQIPEYDLLSLLMSRLPGGGASRRDSRHLDTITGQMTGKRYYRTPHDVVVPPQKMFVGASLPTQMFPLVSQLMDQNTSRWVVGDILGENNSSTASSSNNHNKNSSSDTFGGMTIASNITHSILMVSSSEKLDKLRWLYDTGKLSGAQQVLIFCNSKHLVSHLTQELPDLLSHHNLRIGSVLAKQREETRTATLRRFQNGNLQVLITTDILARGVDFQNVHAVVQWDFPHEFEHFVHRAGRTGRRGESGINIAFFEQQDARLSKQLVSFLQRRRQDVPPKLVTYARQSWSDLYREQVHGMQMRAFDPRHPEVRKNPLGTGERKWPNVESLERRNNKAKHATPYDLKETW